jgi:hypothetical protein
MIADEHDLNPLSFTLHETVAEVRRRLGGEGPSYQWVYARVLSGELPAEKIGQSWRLPAEAADILTNLWRTRRRRSSCAA